MSSTTSNLTNINFMSKTRFDSLTEINDNELYAVKLPMIDYVVDYQMPTSENNYTWYRLYKSGWVEQGGYILGSSTNPGTVTLPIEMAGTKYQIFGNPYYPDATDATFTLQCNAETTTTVTIRRTYTARNAAGSAGEDFWWEVKGMSAQS